VREKRSVEIAAVLADKTPFVSLTVPKPNGRGTLDLQVKEVVRKVKAGQGNMRRCRYIVCYNEAEARNDAAAREAALAGLENALRQGDKARVGNKGFRRFLKIGATSHFAIDPDRVAAAAKFDGIYVIRTNAQISPLVVALRYRERWIVDIDQAWRLSRIKGWVGSTCTEAFWVEHQSRPDPHGRSASDSWSTRSRHSSMASRRSASALSARLAGRLSRHS
jgi:hypothetical protein